MRALDQVAPSQVLSRQTQTRLFEDLIQLEQQRQFLPTPFHPYNR